MKTFISAVAVAAALAVPALSFAQQADTPVTRAQVRQELIQLEQAGYNPAMHSPYYPDDLQAAQRRVDEQQGSTMAAGETSGYGGVAAGSGQSGSRVQVQPSGAEGVQPVYFGR